MPVVALTQIHLDKFVTGGAVFSWFVLSHIKELWVSKLIIFHSQFPDLLTTSSHLNYNDTI